MNVYWYWPYLRREELVLADGVVDGDDRLAVHTTPREADPIVSTHPRVEVRATLPAVAPAREGSVVWAASRARTYARRARARSRAVRDGRFDVAHVVYLNPFTDAFALERLQRRVALVSSVHDAVPHHRRLPGSIERRLLLRQYRGAGTIVVHHDAVRRHLVSEFDVDARRVVEIPLPIPELPLRDQRHEGPPTVLLFGTLRRNKGVAVLLGAIEALRGEIDARFVLAGRGVPELETAVRAAAALDPRVVAEIGYATAARKDELYAMADLVVLPYTSFASQSAVLRDAYAARVPVVVSDVGALGETVRGERTGWVVPPGDPVALAATLQAALGDEPARQAARAAADAIARARSPHAVGRQLCAVYERAAGSRGWAP